MGWTDFGGFFGPKVGQMSTGELHGEHWKAVASRYSNSLGQSGYAGLGTGLAGAQQNAFAHSGALAQLNAAQQAANSLARYNAYHAALQRAFAQRASVATVPGYEHAKVKYEGIRTGEIVAFRAWRLKAGLLQSMAAETLWGPDEPMAGEVKSLGVHAFKRQADACNYAASYPPNPIVIGRIQLWGEVVEHEHGYRAEFGRPYAFDFMMNVTREPEILICLRERYKIGVKPQLATDA